MYWILGIVNNVFFSFELDSCSKYMKNMRHPVVKSYEADLMSFHNTFYLAPKIKAINVPKSAGRHL